MTTPTHKNQVGQAGTGINGGEFAKKTQTEDGIALATTPKRLNAGVKSTAESTLEQLDQFITAFTAGKDVLHGRLAVDAVLESWPAAAKAYVGKPWSAEAGEDYVLTRVVDTEGNVLFNGGYTVEARRANDHIAAIADYETFTYDPADPNIEELGQSEETLALDLTRGTSYSDVTFAETAGIRHLPLSIQYSMLNATAEATGQVLIPASKAEFEYRLDEFPEELGFTEETGKQLDEKFGSRDNALQALIDTKAFLDFDENASEYVYERKNDAIKAAIREALAS